MQKKSLFKGLLTTAFAAAMAVMVAVPAKAAPAAPALSLKNTVTSDKHVTGYTFSVPKMEGGNRLYINVYKADPKSSLTGTTASGTISERRTYGVKEIDTRYNDETGQEETYTNYGYNSVLNSSGGYYYYGGYAMEVTPAVSYEYFVTTNDDYIVSGGTEFSLDTSKFAPGTYYVTATLFDAKGYENANRNFTACQEAYSTAYYKWIYDKSTVMPAIVGTPNVNEYYSAQSAPVQINVTGGVSVSTAVTATSVQLDMGEISSASGYEIYRKAGKKFVKIATTSKATYLDAGLDSKTKYTYKVKPYYYNSLTGQKVMGDETQVSATTNGSALNLKAQVKGKKNVVLTWSKVKGAQKYEIYRSTRYSTSTSVKKGQKNDFSGYELAKTVKKSKKKFVDKKAVAGESYSYLVRAVLSNDAKKKDNKKTTKKLDVEEATGVSLTFESVDIYAQGAPIVKSDGSKLVQWAKVPGATGYVVEKYNEATQNWDVFASLGKNATKVTLPAAAATQYQSSTSYNSVTKIEYPVYSWSTYDSYRICAVKGTTRSSAQSVRVDARLASVNNINAVKTANGIQVSWDAVPGAAYYKVYRVKAGSLYNDKDAGCYLPNVYKDMQNANDRERLYDESVQEYLEKNGTLVTNYVGITTLGTPVDVAAYNANIDNKQKSDEDCVEKHMRKLTEGKTYYYQNYSYATSEIVGTSVLDYAGYVTPANGVDSYEVSRDVTTGEPVNVYYAIPSVVNDLSSRYVGPQNGVSYQYYVIAYAANACTIDTYYENSGITRTAETDKAAAKWLSEQTSENSITPNSSTVSKVTVPKFTTQLAYSVGAKKIATVTYSDSAAPSGKAKLKAVKSPKKKTVSISFKKVAGATSYNIYRSTKKKGKYTCVANVTKTKYKDKTVQSGKKYYYKVVAVNANEAGADVEGKASKPKAVKAK